MKQILPFDQGKVSALVAKRGVENDGKIALNCFIEQKCGVCRHQALAAAYLLERLANEGYIRGKVSVDRNSVPGRGGHAWTRYVSFDGTIFIIDAAQNYCGKLSGVPEYSWFYKRP